MAAWYADGVPRARPRGDAAGAARPARGGRRGATSSTCTGSARATGTGSAPISRARGSAPRSTTRCPLHRQPAIERLGLRLGALPEAERAARELLALPIYPELTAAQVATVVDAIAAFYRGGSRRRVSRLCGLGSPAKIAPP